MSKPEPQPSLSWAAFERLLVWTAPLVLLGVGIVLFPSSGRDDVHISYWAAQTLREHGQIMTYAGELAEQSSSLLHVLLLAAVSGLSGLAMPAIGTPLSLLFGLLAVRETGLLAKGLGSDHSGSAMWLAAASTPLVYWSFGALETTLVAFVLTAFLRQLLVTLGPRQGAGSTVLTLLFGSAYLLARPEAVFVQQSFLFAALVVYWPEPIARRRLIILTLTLLAIFVALSGWRQLSFGSVFPLPVSAKVHLNLLDMLADGWWYLGHTLRQVPLLIALLLGVASYGLHQLVRNGFQQRGLCLCLLLVGAQCSFVVASGGDWMEGGRFFVPAIPALVAITLFALRNIAGPIRYALLGSFVLACLMQTLWFARHHSTGVPLHQLGKYQAWAERQQIDASRYGFFDTSNRVHLRDALFIPKVEHAIETALQDRDELVMMSAQAGMVPFYILQKYADKIRFIDMAGLTSSEFVNCSSVLDKNPTRASSRGVGINDEYYLEHYEAFRDECGIPPADIYFNIDNPQRNKADILAQSGHFEILHRQLNNICAPKSWCPYTFAGNIVLARAIETKATGSPPSSLK